MATEMSDITAPVDPTNHVGGTEVRDAKEATYKDEGYTGDTYCLGCDAKIADGTSIPKKTHSHSDSSDKGSSTYAIIIKCDKHGCWVLVFVLSGLYEFRGVRRRFTPPYSIH